MDEGTNPLESVQITTDNNLVIEMGIVLDALMTGTREFNPLAADHPAVTMEMRCPVCLTAFEAGAITVLIPVAPADEDAYRKWREQRAYTARAELIHSTCVRPLIEEIARYVQERDQPNASGSTEGDVLQHALPEGHPEEGDDRIHD